LSKCFAIELLLHDASFLRLSRERAKVLLEIRDSSAESKQLQMFSRSLLGSLTEKDGIIEQLSNTTKHFGKRVFDLENEVLLLTI
jgi:hypothetical protein